MIRLEPILPVQACLPGRLAEREAEMRRTLAASRAAQRFRERRRWWRSIRPTLFQRCLAVHLLNATTPSSALR
jgi:hypothetical protein